jgi:D-sedoheptulose 7-phosphate isomerase
MHETITRIIDESIATKQKVREQLVPRIQRAAMTIIDAYRKGNKLLICGNGGSAADAQHFAAELVVKLEGEHQRAFPAIALNANTSNLTAIGNDFGYEHAFSRQVEALGTAGDVLIAITTSGNSPNVLLAIGQARKQGVKVIGLLGRDGGKAAPLCDQSIIVPATDTGRIQESHIMIIHALCKLVVEALQ